MKCCLCNKEIGVKGGWKHGNNAEPIKSGRCCDDCDKTKVIPIRIFNAFRTKGK
jgi:hypothetical protein